MDHSLMQIGEGTIIDAREVAAVRPYTGRENADEHLLWRRLQPPQTLVVLRSGKVIESPAAPETIIVAWLKALRVRDSNVVPSTSRLMAEAETLVKEARTAMGVENRGDTPS